MIIDLVEAVGGSLCQSSGLSAQFETVSHAVSAAKHIQRAIQEFSDHSASQKIGAAILVTDADPKSDPEIRPNLDQAAPGQILVASSVRKVLPENGAWKFRGVDANSATGAIPTAEELLWTDQATYDHLAEILRSGETWNVISEPLTTPEPPPVADSTIFDATQIPIATHLSDTDGMFEALEEPPGSKVRYLIAAAVILASMLGGYAFLHFSQNQQPTTKTGTSVASDTDSKKTADTPVTPKPKVQSAEASTAPPKGVEANGKPPAPPVEPKPSASVASLPPRKIDTPPPVVPSGPVQRAADDAGGSGLYRMTAAERAEAAKAAMDISPKQINQILAMADEQAGDGKFSEARRKYLIVLYLDSRNVAANRGMLRLVKRQQQADR